MCGLSGFIGLTCSEETKLKLTMGLAAGIDNRGGDASGYVSISSDGFRYCRKPGKWGTAKERFIKGASTGNLCMMHARLATCGKGGVEEGHPYAISRNGKVVLWGAHNGMIHNAFESAKKHNHDIAVDSQEVFELLADNNIESINKLTGYGVITWVDAKEPDHVKTVRLSKNSEFEVVLLEEGGVVWASTWNILSSALKEAGLKVKTRYKYDDVGKVYLLKKDSLYYTDITGIKLAENNYSHYYGGGSNRWGHSRTSLTEYDMNNWWKRGEEDADRELLNDVKSAGGTEEGEGPYEVWEFETGSVKKFYSEENADKLCKLLTESGKAAEVFYNPSYGVLS